MAYCVPLGIPHSRFLSWAPEDQDKALAFMRHRTEVCSGCGTHPDDWERNPNAYFGDYHVCPGCQRLEEERGNVPEGLKGVHYRLVTEEEADRKIAEMVAADARRRERMAQDDDA